MQEQERVSESTEARSLSLAALVISAVSFLLRADNSAESPPSSCSTFILLDNEAFSFRRASRDFPSFSVNAVGATRRGTPYMITMQIISVPSLFFFRRNFRDWLGNLQVIFIAADIFTVRCHHLEKMALRYRTFFHVISGETDALRNEAVGDDENLIRLEGFRGDGMKEKKVSK